MKKCDYCGSYMDDADYEGYEGCCFDCMEDLLEGYLEKLRERRD